MPRVIWLLLLLMVAAWCMPARAGDPCPLLRSQTASPDPAVRLAAHACAEHQRWHAPFIDQNGRLASQRVTEGEASRLADGGEAWRRVASYWNESGLLPMGRPGAAECTNAATSSYASSGCRVFVVETPWSAAFVSWVARTAALPGFTGSASHVNYVRRAYRNPQDNAYRVADPLAAPPRRGDMLCYVRVSGRVFGFGGLASLLASSDEGLGMHCDIVVGAQTGATRMAYLVGGNVLDGVTLRMLPLDANGRFSALSRRTPEDPPCTPDQQGSCGFNRQDWAVLLQLRPASELAMLAPPSPPVLPYGRPAQPPQQQCCTICVVGSGVPRCPSPGTVVPPQPQE